MIAKLIFITTALISTAHASLDYKCFSGKDAPAYYGDRGQWVLEFTLTPMMKRMKHISLKNKSNDLLGVAHDEANVDSNFTPRNPQYQNHYRYTVADAWCSYSILLPQHAVEQESFRGVIYSACEAGSGGTFQIFCKQIN